MSRDQKPTDDVLAQPRTRRQFLVQLMTPVAAAAISPALAVAATKPTTKTPSKSKGKPATADPFASARPDLSVAKTAEGRATLEKQWKGLVDVLEVVRKAELPQGAAPAVMFAALARDGGFANAAGKGKKKS